MKKLIIVAVVGILLGLAQASYAANEIVVNVSLESTIEVSLDFPTWGIGDVTLSDTATKDFVATVGNSATKLQIKGDDGAGGWIIGTPAAADKFEVAVTAPAIKLTKVNQELAASVAAYGNKPFTLTYKAPSSDTKGGGVGQGFTITLTASAP